MKTVFKSILFLFFGVFLILGIALATSHLWIHRAVAAIIHEVTGLPVTIERAHVNLIGTEFGVYGVKIKNPEGFSDQLLASLPEIYVDFDFSQFFADGKLHFEVIRLNLEELSIVRNEQGVTNLATLKTLKKDKKEAAAKPGMEAKPVVKRRFLIDELVITIRNVKYSDQSLPVPINRTIDLKINQEVFRGVTNLGDIIRIILRKVIYDTSFRSLGAPVDLLTQQFGPSLLRGQEVLMQSTEIAKVMGTEVLGQGRRIVEDATSKIPATLPVPPEVNQITDEVKGKANGLFKGAERFLKTTTDSLSEKIGEKQDSSKT